MKKRPLRPARKKGKKPIVRKKTVLKKKTSRRQNQSKIDEKLLNLPHSSLSRINKSLERLENFSSGLAERNGLTGILGRAVLLRASAIRESLNSTKKKKSLKNKAK